MNDELKKAACIKCKKNPCVCPNKSDNPSQTNLDEKIEDKETYPRTKPPKLTWL